ncbi:hypothetical protein [Ruminiclostridium papyrosolvens]|uniref:Flagellar hook-length control protein-like C-terminal domain-containing protein n=1 Tax=Ruminiclostridium papyrosolvens C7 TaxID=1330534 RepID=U4R4T2_9FIRM|nr:hypothetical protein [Ruminiclostridium papyrosolvens]EPR13530.1 hypothetical protein L323_03570 [Ruminiclostridium papyrosolvens C7]
MRIDGLAVGQINISNNNTDILNKLKQGDVIRAQILENSGEELTIKLSDGSEVHANALTTINAKEGDFVNFVFKGTEGGKLVLESLGTNMAQPVNEALVNAKSALALINLPMSDKNIEMAMALLKQNVPVTNESLLKMEQLTIADKGLKADAAAFLIASKLSDNINNIEKLQNLLSGRLKITDNISGLIKLVEGAGETETPKTPQEIVNRLASIVKENNENVPVKAAVMDNLLERLTSTIKMKFGNAEGIVEGSSASNSSAGKSGAALLTGNSQTTVVQSSAASANQVNTENIQNSPAKTEINQLLRAENGFDIDNSTTPAPLSKADLPVLRELRNQLQTIAEEQKLTQEQFTAIKYIAKEISNTIDKIGLRQKELDNFNLDAGKQHIIKDAVNTLKNLIVRIDRQNNEEINPVKLYNELESSLTVVKNAIQHLPSLVRETAVNIVNNLESNVNFINQLNNYSSYVQLPLSIFNKNTTGELYMLKKGSKAKKLDPSNLTVLLSLETNNIGRIDTLLSIKEKDVSTNFRLEDSGVFNILKDSHKMLYNSLLEKGYRLVDFTYKLLEDPISIVNFEEEAKKEFIKTPNNIDILV